MQSILLEHPSIFDRSLRLLTHIPAFGKVLPSLFTNRAIQFYKNANLSLKAEQKDILHLDQSEAMEQKRRFEKALKWLSPSEKLTPNTKPAYAELVSMVSAVVKTLKENLFLVTLVLNNELEPGDKLEELLEDYYDGLLVNTRQSEDSIPWEQVKAELDAKHGLA